MLLYMLRLGLLCSQVRGQFERPLEKRLGRHQMGVNRIIVRRFAFLLDLLLLDGLPMLKRGIIGLLLRQIAGQ